MIHPYIKQIYQNLIKIFLLKLSICHLHAIKTFINRPDFNIDDSQRRSLTIGLNNELPQKEYSWLEKELINGMKDMKNQQNQQNQKEVTQEQANAQFAKLMAQGQSIIQDQEPVKRSLCTRCTDCVCSILLVILCIVFLPLIIFVFCCCCICGACCGTQTEYQEGYIAPQPVLADQQDVILTKGVCTVCRRGLKVGSSITRLNCQQDHIFHSSCVQIYSMYKKSCPKCSKRLENRRQPSKVTPATPQSN